MTDNNRTKHSKVSVVKHSLKFLSWNIQAPSTCEGNKFEIRDFTNVIMNHDFVCLQEIRKNVCLPGYRAKYNLRKDENSGGVGILVKNELYEGLEFFKDKDGTDYLICKLDKNFFQQPKDIYLVNVYVKPHNSTDKENCNLSGLEIMDKVENLINNLIKKGEIILCGDFNSRIGLKTGMIEQDSNKFLPMPEDSSPDDFKVRYSQDTKCNPYGNKFIKIVTYNQLTILNGRTLGDFLGKFTSIQQQGCSVVDYFSVSKTLNKNVNYLKI